ncbi:hypothetical protein MKK75_17900 [Methylobacterium sp. J-030]|uniref:hypothetical protein n=1 Tax=Methylobacterium sp. J-030 TaxID=2836627 RepID=UPI001FBB9C79|nr:hypothetical protein [Methylobacterium sp. J-030]MCJ2070642.1 hypothetical protein [Methylobacterium sp. J-030]
MTEGDDQPRPAAVPVPYNPSTNSQSHDLEGVQFRELMAIERARIDSSNRRTEVVREMISAQVAQNAREFEFATSRMEGEERREKRRLSLFTRIVFTGAAVGVIILTFLMYVAFYGSPENAKLAQSWLTAGAQALGGGAALVVVGQILLRLLKSPPA